MTRLTAPLIFGALGLGFWLGVLAAASLDRRAAFRQPHTHPGDVDEHGWTEADHVGLEDVLRIHWGRP